MNNTKKKPYSLRNRVILTLSLLVIIVATIIVYVSSDMIYKDKRAYLYENALTSVSTGLNGLETFFKAKERIIEASLNQNPDDHVNSSFWSQDEDLYQLRTFKMDDKFLITEGAGYTNQAFVKKYNKKNDFLTMSFDEILPYLQDTKDFGFVKKLLHTPNKPPRLVILAYLPNKDEYLLFDFFLDNIMEKTFGTLPYEVSLLDAKGKIVYNNRPYNLTKSQEKFYLKFLPELSADDKKTSGVRELNIGKEINIVTFKRSDIFKEFFVIGSIRTSQAYEVTRLFIVNTFLYSLGLVGFFNVISLFLARAITKPLDTMNATIKNIMGGQEDARIEPQRMRELELVGTSFNLMIEKIQDYSRSLEQKVEERTKELKKANDFIQTMLDSLSQGFLVLNQQGICLSIYTKACLTLLGTNPDGKELATLINYEDKSQFNDWINVLFEEPIPFQSLVALGPKSIPMSVPYTDPTFKHVALEFFPMRGEDQKVINIVMVATDKTKEFLSVKENEIQQNHIKMLSKILKDRSNFSRFVGQFKEALKDQKVETPEQTVDFMRLLHSLKGVASFYNLTEIVHYLHDFETFVSGDNVDVTLIPGKIAEASAILQETLVEISEFSDTLMSTSSKIEIDELQLRTFFEQVLERDPKIAYAFKNSFLDISAETYIDQYKILVPELAQKLGKKINPMIILNGDLKVDRSYFQPFFDSCIHLFRNSVDHGIESPEKRGSLHKDEAGTITVTFLEKMFDGKKFLVFEVQDNGAGIDAQIIRNKMIKLNYPQDQVSETDEEIVMHIFDPSFSTAEVTTDISGRGIGLYDIKVLVGKFGGEITVNTVPTKGTKFTFKLLEE